MKKIIFLTFILSMIILNSCSESFLEKDPPLNVSEKDILAESSRIESNLLGLYASLKSNGLLAGKLMVAFDNRGEDFINIGNNLVTLTAVYRMSTNDADNENATFWSTAYRAINSANTFIEIIEGAREKLGKERVNLNIAEAKYVRSVAYYYLCMMYAKQPYTINPAGKAVPLRLKAEKDNTGQNMPASTIEQVYAQILDDLSDANINLLPSATATYNAVTKASKGAALMLRMRVKMAMNNWDGAIADGNAISGYSLTPTVKAAFSSPFYTSENIFSYPMAANNVPGTQYSAVEYYYGSPVIMIFNLDPPGILSDPAYSQEKDARIATLTVKNANNQRQLTKFPTGAKTDWIPQFRYAETLLNLAECYAAKGGAAENDAKKFLKQVRRRSIAEADDILKDDAIDALTGDALKMAIYKERRLEFAGEGMRGCDIVRRGETFPEKGTGAQNVPAIPPTSGSYVWPYPSLEININKELSN